MCVCVFFNFSADNSVNIFQISCVIMYATKYFLAAYSAKYDLNFNQLILMYMHHVASVHNQTLHIWPFARPFGYCWNFIIFIINRNGFDLSGGHIIYSAEHHFRIIDKITAALSLLFFSLCSHQVLIIKYKSRIRSCVAATSLRW